MKTFDRKFGAQFFDRIPAEAGVYRYLDESGTVVYVGKAKSLRRRLGQYRNARRLKAHWKMREILKHAARLEWEVCTDEGTALLRELELIQTLKPRFNEASTFFSYYPYIGWKRLTNSKTHIFVQTRKPELFPDFELHGAFRSGGMTGAAFEGLETLLRRVAHPLPRSKTWGKEAGGSRDRFSVCFAVQGLPEDWLVKFGLFLRGQDRAAMEELVLTLLEQSSSRFAKRGDLEAAFLSLRRFWRHEIRPLAEALSLALAQGQSVEYPVAQRERDALFLRVRAAGAWRRNSRAADLNVRVDAR